MRTDFRSAARVIAVASFVVLASVATSCGSDSEADKGSGSSDDKQQISEVIRGIQKAYEKKDPSLYCGLSTEALQKAAKEALEAKSCEDGFLKFLELDLVEEDIYPSALAYEIDGDRASVTGYTKHTDSRQKAFFVKTDDEWKLALWFRGNKPPPDWYRAGAQ